MKKLFLFILIISSTISVMAQTHYVIAFDCTRSMNHPDGDYSDDGLDPQRVWEPAKEAVRDIFNASGNQDRFTIILFQDKVLDVCDGEKSSLTWSSINNRMENVIRSYGYNTCILTAWERAEQYLASSTCANTVFYLITDGVEEHDTKSKVDVVANKHTDELIQKILQFCSTHRNTQGFYTNLVRSLRDPENNVINKALDQSDCFHILVSGHFDSPIIIDMDETKQNYNQDVVLIFHPEDRDRVPVTVENIELVSSDDYFDLKLTDGCICDNKLNFSISLKGEIPQNIKDKGNYSFPITITSSQYAKCVIHEQHLIVTVNLKLSRAAYLPTCELFGESVYQKPFKLIEKIFPDIAAERAPTVIRFNLDSVVRAEGKPGLFNDEAIRQGAELKMKLCSRTSKPVPPVTIKYNGNVCNDYITIRSTDQESVIEIIFDKNAKAKKYSNLCFQVERGDINNLDRINLSIDCEYSDDVTLVYSVKSNPWYVAAIWIVVLIVIVLFIWIIIANFPTRKMHGQLMPNGQFNVRLEGNVKSVMTSTSQRQNLISRLFKGPISYSRPDVFWTSDLIIKKGNRNNVISILPSSVYEIDGMLRATPYTVSKGGSFLVRNINTNKTTTINYQ